MLTGAQLATAIAAVLAGAIVLGWVLRWIWTRMAGTGSDAARLAEAIDRLHAAERARAAAEDAQRLAERRLAAREAEMASRLAELQAQLGAAVEERDTELARLLHEARAEAAASMAGLRSAEQRIIELEDALAVLHREGG
jgi:DNA repair exonuclease SbcCD ATPase subunit